MKRRVLLVIKDQLEFRSLINDVFLPGLLARFEVVLMCPGNRSAVFREGVRARYPAVVFLDAWFDDQVSLGDRAMYWLKNELYFLLNAPRSETCFQKVFLSLELPIRALTGRILEDAFARRLAPFFNSKTWRGIAKGSLKVLSVLLSPLRNFVFRHRTFHSDITFQERFDYVFFGRPNSFSNIAVQKAFADSSTKIVTFCRNFDVPASKGVFTVPSDYTIVFDRFLCGHLRDLNSPLNYGQVILYDHPLVFFKKGRTKECGALRQILYAANAEVFVPNEGRIVRDLFESLTRARRSGFQLHIRPHPTDRSEAHTRQRFHDVLQHDNVVLERLDGCALDGAGSGAVPFPTPDDADRYYERILRMDLVISSFSTINYEAKLLGVPSVFLSIDPTIAWISRRDHLRLLSERHGIPVLTNAGDVSAYVS